jgi:hypothetical protein
MASAPTPFTVSSNEGKAFRAITDSLAKESIEDGGSYAKTLVEKAFVEALNTGNYDAGVLKISTDLGAVRDKYHVNTVAGNFTGPYDPTGANLTTGTTAVEPVIRSKVFDKLTDKEAKRLSDDFLNTNDDIVTYTGGVRDINVNPALVPKFQAEVGKSIKAKVDAQASLIDSGVIDYAKLKDIITNTANPQLIVAFENLKKQKFADEVKKEEEGTKKTAAEREATTFNRNIGTETDMSAIADKILTSPGFSSYPAIVQDVLKARLNVEKAGYIVNEEADKKKKAELDAKKELEKLNQRISQFKLWGQRMKWIGGGLLIGGIATGLLITPGASAFLSPALATFISPAVAGGAASLTSGAIGMLAGAGIGGLAGGLASELADKKIKDQKVANATAAAKFAEYNKEYLKLDKAKGQRSIGDLTLLTKMGAMIASADPASTFGQEQALEAYIKKMGLKDLDKIINIT